jgi:acetyl esterase/lipase
MLLYAEVSALKKTRLALPVLAGFMTLSSCAFSQQQIVPLWPHGAPEQPLSPAAETDTTKPTDGLIDGRRTRRLTNVSVPTITIYRPSAEAEQNPAALVFPGGGYARLAWDGEGVDTCSWLTSVGVTCLLVKYRVPVNGHYPDAFGPLEDAQQAIRMARQHAKEWKLDPKRIGAVGFSAGGNLAALLSTHPDERHVESTPAAADVDTSIDARPNFAILVYPAYLVLPSDGTKLDPIYTPNAFTPPTFLIQAEDDSGYGRNAPVYYQALAAAKIPAELHMYATGGHGFGVTPPGKPEEHWTEMATIWLRSLGMAPRP